MTERRLIQANLFGPAGFVSADDGEVIRQEAVFGQMIKGGDDLAVGEVAGGAEDDRCRGWHLGGGAGDHRGARGVENGDQGHGGVKGKGWRVKG